MMIDRNVGAEEEDRKMRRQLGILGTHIMNLNETLTNNDQTERRREVVSPQPHYQSYGRPESSDSGGGRGEIDKAALEIREYRNDIRGFYTQLPEIEVTATLEDIDTERGDEFFSPLIKVLNRHKLEYDAREVVKRRSLELHFGNIMGALSTRDTDSGQLLVTLRRWYNDFFWNFSKAAVGMLVGLGKTLFGVVQKGLFGRAGILGMLGIGADKRSDNKKIIDAIKEQTEFFLTGKIDQTKGLVARLKQFGLIGTSVRAVADTAMAGIGLSRERHQSNVIDRASGVKKDRSEMGLVGGTMDKIGDYLSEAIYSKSVVKYGKIEQISKEKDPSLVVLEKQLFVGMAIYDLLKRGLTLSSDTRDESQKVPQSIVESIVETVETATQSITSSQKAYPRSDVFSSANTDNMTVGTPSLISDMLRDAEVRDTRESVENKARDERTEEYQKSAIKGNSSIIKYTKATAREVLKHRRQALYHWLTDKVTGLAKALGGGALKLLGGLASALGLKKLFDRLKPGSKKPGSDKSGNTRSRGRLDRTSKLGGKTLDRMSKLGGRTLDTLKSLGGKTIDLVKTTGSKALKIAGAASVAAAAGYGKVRGTISDRLNKSKVDAGDGDTKGKKKKPVTGRPSTAKKMAGRGIVGMVASVVSGAIVSNTDEESHIGGVARTAEKAINWGIIGGMAGTVLGGIVGTAMGPGGTIAGAVLGNKIGMALGATAGIGAGSYENRKAIIEGKPKDEEPVRDWKPRRKRSRVMDQMSENFKPKPPPSNMLLKDHKPEPKISVLDNAVDDFKRNQGGIGGLMFAVQESIQIPIDYAKDLYKDLTDTTEITNKTLTEGNAINKEVVQTLKEMSRKLDKEEPNPFGTMFDPSMLRN